MNELTHRICELIAAPGKQFSIVKNHDGFLSRPDVQQSILSQCNLLLLPIASPLELRVRFETVDKHSTERVCYIISNAESVLPDLLEQMHTAPVFDVASLFPALDRATIHSSLLSWNTANYLYNQRFYGNVSPQRTAELMSEAENAYGIDSIILIEQLKSVEIDWQNAETIISINRILLKAIRNKQYTDIEPAIDEINKSFQQWIDKSYFGLPTSNYFNTPKIVNRILPHIAQTNEIADKVVLIVVDGMAYWQYLMLDDLLAMRGIDTDKRVTMAWLPSITKLSRQAIFLGSMPNKNYRQSQLAESKMWKDFWMTAHIGEHEIMYDSNLTYSEFTRSRVALVDITLDERMHNLDDNKDLFDLTVNWAEKAVEQIDAIHRAGYTIYITTDHGNVLARAWQQLSSAEKTFLYKADSRGSRQLTYENSEYLGNFVNEHPEITKQLIISPSEDNHWLAWRTARCFKNNDEITHGGSHFLEMVIPFIKISKKQ